MPYFTHREPARLLGAVQRLLIASGIDPVADRFTWLLETVPVMIGICLPVPSRRHLPPTRPLYRLLAPYPDRRLAGGG